MIISLMLYCVLGLALYFSGIYLMEKPIEFFTIMIVVVLIDMVSMSRALGIL